MMDTFFNEVHKFLNTDLNKIIGTNVLPAADVKPPTRSRIRIRFNRPLTWSERETLNQQSEDYYNEEFKFSKPDELFVESALDSRTLYESIAGFVEDNYVNLHPVAVRTFKESNIFASFNRSDALKRSH